MLSRYRGGVVWSLMVLVSWVGGQEAQAGTGRDVRATYEFQGAVVAGDQVSGTFAVSVSNYGGDALSGVVFKLENEADDALQPGAVYLSSDPIAVAAAGSSSFEGAVTVPLEEYESWQHGAMPRLLMEYTSETGVERVQPVEVTARNGGANDMTDDQVDQMLQSLPPASP